MRRLLVWGALIVLMGAGLVGLCVDHLIAQRPRGLPEPASESRPEMILSQYTPTHETPRPERAEDLDRRIRHLLSAVENLREGGMEQLADYIRHEAERLTQERKEMELQERERYERELQIGREIQRSFFPKTLPRHDGWEIDARFQPATEVSGDFYVSKPPGLLCALPVKVQPLHMFLEFCGCHFLVLSPFRVMLK